jgi:hypothetical protein
MNARSQKNKDWGHKTIGSVSGRFITREKLLKLHAYGTYAYDLGKCPP